MKMKIVHKTNENYDILCNVIGAVTPQVKHYYRVFPIVDGKTKKKGFRVKKERWINAKHTFVTLLIKCTSKGGETLSVFLYFV